MPGSAPYRAGESDLPPDREPAAADSATLARLQLGVRLRALRAAAGITGGQAAQAIRASGSKISRIESGQLAVHRATIVALIRLYQVDEAPHRELLLDLARRSEQRAWWDDYADVLLGSLRHRLCLEAAAARILIYEPQSIPVLLQTDDYARAQADLADNTALRGQLLPGVHARRRELLKRNSAVPKLWVLLDEAVLYRSPAPGTQVMARQIVHLAEMAHSPAVTIQLVSLQSSQSLAAPGPFQILRFGPRELPDMVIIEHLTGTLYPERQQDRDSYRRTFDQMCVASRKPTESAELLAIASMQQTWPPSLGG